MCAEPLKPSAPIAYADARARLRQLASTLPLREVSRPILESLGAVLVDDVYAPRAIPGFRNSAMDGYAFAAGAEQLRAGARFRIVADLRAGDTLATFDASSCIAIATGAMLPDCAHTVIPKERVSVSDGIVELLADARFGAHVRASDEDFQAHQLIARAGTRIHAEHMATASHCGLREWPVIVDPRTAILVTGSELVSTGQAPAIGHRIDSNGPLLSAWFREYGIDVTRIGPWPDDLATLQAEVARLSEHHDLLIITGGASVGPVDFVPQVLHTLGDIQFWRVAVKPGMPVVCARIGRCLVLGLPGNPVSVFAGLHGFVEPLLRAWRGQDEAAYWQARLTQSLSKSHDRLEWRRGRLDLDITGQLWVRPHESESSGAMRSVVESNALLVLPAHLSQWREGELVDVIPYRGLD